MAITQSKKKVASKEPKKGSVSRVKKMATNKDKTEQEASGDSAEDGESDSEDADEEEDYAALLRQIKSEWEVGWWYIKPKWDEWALRLKLFNNQKRDKEAVGDNTLFSVFNTVLAELYEDRLGVSWRPRERGDDDIAENLDALSEYDYEEMQKDEIDYEWDWEACFFGRSLLCNFTFDREAMVPVPEVWNVMSVVRDPEARSVNGAPKTGKGRARFLYREIRMSKGEMEEAGVYKNYDALKPDSANSTKSLIDEYMRVSGEAAGLTNTERFRSIEGENATLRLIEGFTIYKNKRVLITCDSEFKNILRIQELPSLDIPIVDRVIYPMSASWDGVSIPDLVEDKQRGRAVAVNLALKTVKSGLYPMYLYDTTRIQNKADLNFEFNKFIGVNGRTEGAVEEMPRAHVKQDVQFILDTLDAGAQKASATSDIRQGVRPSAGATATRDALVEQGVSKRYSLSARVFGWSEKRFWRTWYGLYKEHLNQDIDEKVIRLSGALGAKWRTLTRENLIAGKTDPDVMVESKSVSDAEKFNELQQFRGFTQVLATVPTANMRLALKYMGKLQGMKRDLLDRILPMTVHELRAEEENELIQAGELAEVLPIDDHMMHMDIHNNLPDSPEKVAHINAHKRAMMLGLMRPDLVPPPAPMFDPNMMPQNGLGAPASDNSAMKMKRPMPSNPTA